MGNLEKYRDLVREAQKSVDYWADVAVMEFTRDLVELMEKRSVTRAELARRLNTSRAYVSKLLGGQANFTIATMTKVALALRSSLHLQLADEVSSERWWVDELDDESLAGCYSSDLGNLQLATTDAFEASRQAIAALEDSIRQLSGPSSTNLDRSVDTGGKVLLFKNPLAA
jgi:transcriptional regulator with XRE-family HTH domain